VHDYIGMPKTLKHAILPGGLCTTTTIRSWVWKQNWVGNKWK